MKFVYKLKHNDKVIKETTDREEFFNVIYEMIEDDRLLDGSTFTTDITEGFTKGTWFLIYSVDNYSIGAGRSAEITNTIEDSLKIAAKVHYGPDCNNSYIYQLDFDGISEVTVVKRINTKKTVIIEIE